MRKVRRKCFTNYSDHLFLNLFHRQAGVHQFHPFFFGPGDPEVSRAHFPVEIEFFPLEPVEDLLGFLDSPEAFLRLEIEKQGEIGLDLEGQGSDHPADFFHPEASSRPLVGQGSVLVTVAKHDFPGGAGGDNHLGQELLAAGQVEQELGPGIDPAGVGRVEKQFSDGFPEPGSARLAGDQDLETPAGKIIREETGLGGLPAPLDTFKRDEFT